MPLKKLFLASAAFTLALAAYSSPASSTSNCPPPRSYSGACITVIVWAKHPQTGLCCQYPTPCSAPEGWEIFYGPGCTNPEIEEL